eukprot:GEMP01036574.1.p1 GENE.GEMP01036574.1~~GEMP01036574.1.p1  ORF type:complete len:405 (+),score=98.77 GEMP01036574.1:268-1482(+)
MVSRIEALLAANQDMYPQVAQDTQRSVAERLKLLLDDYRQTKCALRDMCCQSPSGLHPHRYQTTEGNFHHAHPFVGLPRPLAASHNFVDPPRYYTSQHYFRGLSDPVSPAQTYLGSPSQSYQHACPITPLHGQSFYAPPVVSPVHFPLDAHVPFAGAAHMLLSNAGYNADVAAHQYASSPHTNSGKARTAFPASPNAACVSTQKVSPARNKKKRKVAAALGRGTRSVSPLKEKQLVSGDFRVRFTKVGRRALGIDVTPSRGFLIVRKVQSGGLVAAWNAESQDNSIEVNDIIVEAFCEDHRESYKMLQAVKEDCVITFVVRKHSSPHNSDSSTIVGQDSEQNTFTEQRAGCENSKKNGSEEEDAGNSELNNMGKHGVAYNRNEKILLTDGDTGIEHETNDDRAP